jgi:hypothetical protein
MTLYETMLAIAEAKKPQGYLRAYEADLTTHDRNTLANAPDGARYLWILRENGTQLFEIASGHDPVWATYWLTTDAGHNPPNLVFLASGGTVKPISYDRAIQLAKTPHPEGKVIKFCLS